jgi:hypothetical protein
MQKIYLYIIGLLTFFLIVLPFTFNHINPYVAILLTILLTYKIIQKINK